MSARSQADISRRIKVFMILRGGRKSNPRPGRQVNSLEGVREYGLPIGADIIAGARKLTALQQQDVGRLTPEQHRRYLGLRQGGTVHAEALKAAGGSRPSKPSTATRAARVRDAVAAAKTPLRVRAATPADIAVARTHIARIVSAPTPVSRRRVSDVLSRQARLTPKTMLTLPGVIIPEPHSDSAVALDSLAGGANGVYALQDTPGMAALRIYLHPGWADPVDRYTRNLYKSWALEDGWGTPSGYSGRYVIGATLSHEYGHHVTRMLTNQNGDLGLDEAARLLPAIDRELGTTFASLLSPAAVEKGPGDRWFIPKAHLDKVVAANAADISDQVSGYAGSADYFEMLAEIWQEYSTLGTKARPYARIIGRLMRDMAESRFAA